VIYNRENPSESSKSSTPSAAQQPMLRFITKHLWAVVFILWDANELITSPLGADLWNLKQGIPVSSIGQPGGSRKFDGKLERSLLTV
jgi:hypothetical protein